MWSSCFVVIIFFPQSSLILFSFQSKFLWSRSGLSLFPKKICDVYNRKRAIVMYVCIQSTDFSFLVLGKQTKKWAECKLFCKVFLHILSWIAENFLFFPFFGHFSIFNMERSECSVDLRKTIQNLENMKKNSLLLPIPGKPPKNRDRLLTEIH